MCGNKISCSETQFFTYVFYENQVFPAIKRIVFLVSFEIANLKKAMSNIHSQLFQAMTKATNYITLIIILLGFACKGKYQDGAVQNVTNDKKIQFDPSGIYVYDSIANGNNVYFGEIRIKKYVGQKYIMTFFICKGEPSYNSGSFIDTIEFKSKRFNYTTADDTTCLTTFNVSDSGLVINEKTENYNFGCGFGHAVVAHGFFRKTSNSTPILLDPLNGDTLK
jgi:hypothetical protein